ncbi:MAG: helix-turn-helix domain-containing protein [Patescibacteria group bacterium]|jgi:HTH-type transcriptional regulator/antitoxin HigA
MSIKPIKKHKDYEAALKKVEKLWEAKPNTKAGDELEVLTILIEKYEADTYKILPPDPIEAIKFRMEQMNLQQKDVAKIVGANRVSEIFNKKRKLSLNMIRAFHVDLNIPVDSLIH